MKAAAGPIHSGHARTWLNEPSRLAEILRNPSANRSRVTPDAPQRVAVRC
jgi:hypothetical protein